MSEVSNLENQQQYPANNQDSDNGTQTSFMGEESASLKENEPSSISTVIAHDDFDWNISKQKGTIYSDEEKSKLDILYKASHKEIKTRDIVEGTVVGLTDNEAIISIGAKSDGLVALSEFRDMDATLRIGDVVEVMVLEQEDKKGGIVISHKETKTQRAWDKILQAYATAEIVVGQVIEKSKGGLIVDLFGIKAFLPGSQIDMRVVTDYDQYLGKKMEFKVVKVNENLHNAVVSHKAIVEGRLEEQRINIMSTLEKGQVVEGLVKNITDFGVFMDLGDIDGLLYITDISWTRINHPSDMFEVDQRVNVVILDFDHEKKRISLGLKQLSPHPWNTITDEIKEGKVVEGKVVNVEDYGGFIEILPGVEGLVHVSEISWSNTPVNSREHFKVGDICKAQIISFDKDARKMSLSIKQLEPDPWATVLEKLREGSKHRGVVKNITNYGVFVEMENDFGGMIHVSDLSWTKRINHPKEFISLDDEVEVVVLNVDEENRKVLLGHKQIDPNPWMLLSGLFAEGTTHEGTVSAKRGDGMLVDLPNNMEGYVPSRHLLKEDQKNQLAIGQTTQFIVLEFDAQDKKLVLSHRKVWEKQQQEVRQDQNKERTEVQKVISSQVKIKHSVLGDIEGLADIKQKMKNTEEQSVPKKEKKKK